MTFLNPYFWLGLAALLVVAVLGGMHIQAVKDAKHLGELEAQTRADAAVLTEIRKQQADLQTQVATAQAAAGRVNTVVVDRMKENNSVPIAPGCPAALAYARARIPVLIVHRRMETIP